MWKLMTDWRSHTCAYYWIRFSRFNLDWIMKWGWHACQGWNRSRNKTSDGHRLEIEYIVYALARLCCFINKSRNLRGLRQKNKTKKWLISCFHEVQYRVGDSLGSTPSILLGCHLNLWLLGLSRQRMRDQFFMQESRRNIALLHTFSQLWLISWAPLTARELGSVDFLCVKKERKTGCGWIPRTSAAHVVRVDSGQWSETDVMDIQQGMQNS